MVGPAVAAISLGLVGRGRMDARIGRNAALGAAGNVVWVIATGWIVHAYGPQAMFAFAIVVTVPTIVAALTIRNRDIDGRLARGADRDESNDDDVGRWYDRRLVILCGCAFLFHLANATLLTLVAQELSAKTGNGSLYLSAALVITQGVTISVGLLAGRYASRMPRRPIYLIAFTVLPIRALLYLTTAQPVALVALQVLDGVGAGVFGVMQILVVGDITRGSGRFNLGQGVVGTAVGLGAAISNLLAGTVTRSAGYGTGFMTLAAIAGTALLVFAAAMPETRPQRQALAQLA